jgi:hypothetical protein
METFDPQKRHPLYKSNLARWNFLRDHYEGGLAYLAKSYLSRHERESERNFRRRLADSRYPNFCKPITHLFVSHIWRRKPSRNLPERLGRIAEDVDRFGTDIDAFMKGVTTAAGVEGHSSTGLFWLIRATAAMRAGRRTASASGRLRSGPSGRLSGEARRPRWSPRGPTSWG